MAFKIIVFLVIFPHIYVVTASDPDPINDFCIPRTNFSSIFPSCKNSSLVTIEDFVYSGIRNPPLDYKKNGFSSIPVSSSVFPGLNTQGMSFVRADFEVDGVNVPHYHPRATEVVFVLEGKVYSGFVDSKNKVYAKVLEKGDVMVFPKGLIHFQMNIGDSHATIIGNFNSQNPGLVKIPTAIFGSEIQQDLLMKAFGLNSKEISKLKKHFGSD
ncbi:hypothetical protein M9H77_16978 [Catharanthus roseus]|uniref:Uncharacterized protein n=1 Tax=Catharanthus roseus TaxID=4058 RepID=A0ACC0B3A9_CATRO|nr:hypothetical protein M9H77_16978 [Catharanthus roseus]